MKYRKNTNRKYLVLGVVSLLIILGLVTIYLIRHNSDDIAISTKTIPTIENKDSSVDSSKDTSSDANTATDTTTKDNNSTGTGTTDSTLTLTDAPSGSFVSNHRPSLSSSDLKNEASTCTTIPGATCKIVFTKSDGSTKELTAQKAGNNGTVLWNWDVKSAGFTEGEWTIVATATLNNSSKSTTDSIKLTVLP